MIRKIVVGVAAWVIGIGFAFAQVDVNKADAAMLDAVKGLGPAKSKAILDERTKNGDFKDWSDLQQRVKGIGDKAAMRLPCRMPIDWSKEAAASIARSSSQ